MTPTTPTTRIVLTRPIAAICGSLLMAIAASPACDAGTGTGTSTGIAVAAISSAGETTEQKDEAAAAYSVGVSLVYRGRRLETAAQHLGEAVRLSPKNGDYRLALGCAFVRRAHVLRWASGTPAYYEKLKASYPQRYAAWERAQSDRSSALYGAKPPAPPVPPTTGDDGKAFTLTLEQAKERANDLCRRALAEWDVAVASAGTDAERANAQYVRGWGMSVIRRMGVAWLEEKLVPDQQEIAEAFQAAVALAPDNPRYWQSLGDAYVPDNDLKSWNRDKAAAAYQKALTLDRRSATLWYQLYRVQERNDSASAATAIGKAAEVDSSNAYYQYLLADLLLKRFVREAKKEAVKDDTPSPESLDLRSSDLASGLAALDKGNAGSFRPVTYTYAIPKLLAPLNPYANASGESDALSGDYILILPQNVGLAVKAYLAQGDAASGVAAARAAVRFSDKILALGDLQTNSVSEWMAWTFGSIAAQTSYSSLATALEGVGNAAAAAEARAKMQELDNLARMRVQRANEESKSLQL